MIHLFTRGYAALCMANEPIDGATCTLRLMITSTDPNKAFPGQPQIEMQDHNGKVRGLFEALHVYPSQRGTQAFNRPLLQDTSHFPGPLIHWDRIRKLLNQCDAGHERCSALAKQHEKRSLPSGFRVIDIINRQLIKPVGTCKFVALSYVWGRNPDVSKVKATVSNIHELEAKGGLALGKVSTTIEEAMQACTCLGERYLWADRLCIVQDDAIHKQEQINAMRDIYALADFVMVIVSGNSVDDPIPGVRSPRSSVTEMISFQGYRVLNLLPRLPDLLGQSVWHSRGWTYQEATLSNRKLYLTAVQYVFECNEGHIYEDNSLNDSSWELIDVPFGADYLRRLPAVFDVFDPFLCYKDHMMNFNDRSFTDISDIYNAFAGIASGLYGSPERVLYGLPKGNFDEALLWRPQPEKSRYFKPVGRRSSAAIALPTWSWSSIEGTLVYPSENQSFCGPLLQWALVERSKVSPLEYAEPSRLDGIKWQQSYTSHDVIVYGAPQLMLALAVAEGCIHLGPHISSESWKQERFVDSANTLARRWPRYREFWAESFSHERWQNLTLPPGSAILAAHAQLSTLGLAMHPTHSLYGITCAPGSTYLEIRHQGSCIGMVQPDIPYTKQVPQGVEFLALSLSRCPQNPGIKCLYPNPFLHPLHHVAADTSHTSEEERLLNDVLRRIRHMQATYTDADNDLLLSIPVVNVLMVHREGSFITRLGLGWVFLRRWAEVPRRDDFIFLK
ncbi:Heterokaryon incompatibility [Fusarium albosuccineum]|uniref:Heterokaryon incompatibility n=1 Tax=Fusarium albosuccineum TaxID=1237068 RepID=A0A8H4LL94_9HYPO|nr:Heterokaryon incompatibility [Fusarium albosuccineum]